MILIGIIYCSHGDDAKRCVINVLLNALSTFLFVECYEKKETLLIVIPKNIVRYVQANWTLIFLF